ncbi:tryptophan/tyrosine permease [Actinidia rufa]|uniref:Tryptophan/tyrosine permease n=1 Tax=Actinidia rufa TaxID=165716 RepID=A0A7J0E439_9ERIC|nr:tryptophan/tyrosine permease [Actinidia rufa]
MLSLPAATMRSSPLPSTIAILFSWVHVISSIILVAELSFVAMEEENVSEVIDAASRFLCLVMLFLPTGFHVITPFIKIAGNSVNEARKAILVGGFVPLITVLLWNIIVLGLAGTNTTSSSRDPISFLLSVNPSALSAVQGYAFYAVSFPKQVFDTLELIFVKPNSIRQPSQTHSIEDEGEKVGFATYSSGQDGGNTGKVWYS